MALMASKTSDSTRLDRRLKLDDADPDEEDDDDDESFPEDADLQQQHEREESSLPLHSVTQRIPRRLRAKRRPTTTPAMEPVAAAL